MKSPGHSGQRPRSKQVGAQMTRGGRPQGQILESHSLTRHTLPALSRPGMRARSGAAHQASPSEQSVPQDCTQARCLQLDGMWPVTWPAQVTSGVSQEFSFLPLSWDFWWAVPSLPHPPVFQEWRSPSPVWSGTSPTVPPPQPWGSPAPHLELVSFWEKTAMWKHHPPTSQSLS